MHGLTLFQSLIGVLQTKEFANDLVYYIWFQSLIGVLQTVDFDVVNGIVI